MKYFAFLLLGTVVSAASLGAENPLKKAKIGDFVEHSTVVDYGGGTTKSKMRQTVTKKTDTEVTIEYAMTQGQELMFKREVTLKLDQDYDPAKGTIPMQQQMNVTMKRLETGTQDVSICGKKIQTQWILNEVSYPTKAASGDNATVAVKQTEKWKVWISSDIPIDGIVKMELGEKTKIEMTEFGTGK